MTEQTPAKHQATGHSIQVFLLEDLCNDAWDQCAPANTQGDTGKLLNESLRQKYFETVRNGLEFYVGPLGFKHEPGKPVPENPQRLYKALLNRKIAKLFAAGMANTTNYDKCPLHSTFVHVTTEALVPRLERLESNQWVCLFSSHKIVEELPKENTND